MDNVFLLVPETIEQLSEVTGIPQETLFDMYSYDQQWGLVSKIYVVEVRK